MSKKRRTKREKIQAAGRQNFSSFLTLPQINEVSKMVQHAESKTEERVTNSPVHLKRYAYVAEDVRKTMIITCLLVALNIVFFIILKLKLLTLSGIAF